MQPAEQREPDSVDRLRLVGAPDPLPAEQYGDYPAPVLTALRAIREVRDRHLAQLSAADRRAVAAAERLIARNIDLHAQIDANGGADG